MNINVNTSVKLFQLKKVELKCLIIKYKMFSGSSFLSYMMENHPGLWESDGDPPPPSHISWNQMTKLLIEKMISTILNIETISSNLLARCS